MKRIIYFILAVFFLILGAIGLALPVVPQVPFLLLGFGFLAGASKRVHRWVTQTEFYQKHGRVWVKKSKILESLFGEWEEPEGSEDHEEKEEDEKEGDIEIEEDNQEEGEPLQ